MTDKVVEKEVSGGSSDVDEEWEAEAEAQLDKLLHKYDFKGWRGSLVKIGRWVCVEKLGD